MAESHEMTPEELRAWATEHLASAAPAPEMDDGSRCACTECQVAHAVLALLERHERALALLRTRRNQILAQARNQGGVMLPWLEREEQEIDALLADVPVEEGA